MDLIDLLKYFDRKATGVQSVVNNKTNQIYFDFDSHHIVISFSYIEERDEDFDNMELWDDVNIETFSNNIRISAIFITGTTLIGEQDYDEEIHSKPYYNEMLYYIKHINTYYVDAVKNYIVNMFDYDDCGWGMGCATYEYGFRIEVSEQYWYNKLFFSYIIDNLFGYHANKTLWERYKSILPISFDSEKIEIIASNTKVRRLGYIKYLVSLFMSKRYLTHQILISKISTDIEYLEANLLQYKNTKGLVQKRGLQTSITPYIELAISLKIIQKVNNGYELTKKGIVYEKLLSQQIDADRSENRNVFELNSIDKSVFLEAILNNDYLYIYTILEYAFTFLKPSYKHLKSIFQTNLLHHIDKILETAHFSKEGTRFQLNEVKKRIQTWTKAEVYMEHVLMPRLNWLYDLDIINLNNDYSFNLTPQGEILLKILSSFNDTNQGYVININRNLDICYMHLLSDVYIIDGSVDIEKSNSILPLYIEKCFEIFKTLAPNRITYSVLIAYVKRLFLFCDQIIIEEKNIKEFLLDNPNKYIFKYQKYYKDGYVQLKK